MTFEQELGIRCDVAGRPHALAFLGCRDLNYGQRCALPLHPFRLRVPEGALAPLLDAPFNSFIQTCREDDLQYEESDLPELKDAGYPGITAAPAATVRPMPATGATWRRPTGAPISPSIRCTPCRSPTAMPCSRAKAITARTSSG